ncbi:glycosyltransferase, partial [Candidatus Parcubacteria bacterium]|nr:glycosyltransferase [Candidatus Parcubacteria bacterium]
MENNGKKIAFCVSSFRAGGGERMLVDLANEFSRRGYGVDMVALSNVGEYSDQLDPSVNKVVLKARRMFLSLPGLIRYLSRERPIAMVTLDEHTSIYALIARFLSRAPTRIVPRVGTTYSKLFAFRGMRERHRLWLMRFLYKRADRIIAVSKGVADDVASFLGVPQEKIVTVYNPKSLAFIEARGSVPPPHPWLSDTSSPVIMAAGRFRHPKNYQMLVRAFASVRKTVPARLILVGKGRDEEELKKLVRELHCERDVLFPGYAENPYAWIRRADVFVSTSVWEGMPNALLEAMACGVPVISSDCDSGPREIIAPDTDYRKRITQGVEYAKYGVL